MFKTLASCMRMDSHAYVDREGRIGPIVRYAFESVFSASGFFNVEPFMIMVGRYFKLDGIDFSWHAGGNVPVNLKFHD